MNIMLGLRRGRHAAAAIILLIAAVLAGIVGCDGTGTYQLSISSTSGGSVTTPGEGTYVYPAGTAVRLVAEPDDGYQFDLWTGDIQLMAGPNLASTTIVMNGNYAIVASFEIQGQACRSPDYAFSSLIDPSVAGRPEVPARGQPLGHGGDEDKKRSSTPSSPSSAFPFSRGS